jgi:hypothetical protein
MSENPLQPKILPERDTCSYMQEAGAFSLFEYFVERRISLSLVASFVSKETLQLFSSQDRLHRDMAKRPRAKLAQQYELLCDQRQQGVLCSLPILQH